jgi:hypothetical protein
MNVIWWDKLTGKSEDLNEEYNGDFRSFLELQTAKQANIGTVCRYIFSHIQFNCFI